MDEWVDYLCVYKLVNGCVFRRKNGRACGCNMDGVMDEWMNGWTVGYLEWWMDG
jgi:hypothetical protein